MLFSRGSALMSDPQLPQTLHAPCLRLTHPRTQIHTHQSWLPAPPATARLLHWLLRDPNTGAAGLGCWGAGKPVAPPPPLILSAEWEKAAACQLLLCPWARAKIPLAENAREFQSLAPLTSQSQCLVKALLFWSHCAVGPTDLR